MQPHLVFIRRKAGFDRRPGAMFDPGANIRREIFNFFRDEWSEFALEPNGGEREHGSFQNSQIGRMESMPLGPESAIGRAIIQEPGDFPGTLQTEIAVE